MIALFLSGIAAALLAILLYRTLVPPPQPLSVDDVSLVVAEAMASATPAPAFSTYAYQAVQPALVLIEASGVDSDGNASAGLGSGVVVSAQGEILTANHVVEGATEITVTYFDGTQSAAQIVSATPETDIAVLLPDQLSPMVVPAVLGNPNALRVGDEAFAFGNPFGIYGSMSSGVVSGFNRSFQAVGSDIRIDGLIQMDTAVNPGNSGGPLLNRYGHVVGIVIGILNPTDDEFFVGIGFAVPITVAGGGGNGRGPEY